MPLPDSRAVRPGLWKKGLCQVPSTQPQLAAAQPCLQLVDSEGTVVKDSTPLFLKRPQPYWGDQEEDAYPPGAGARRFGHPQCIDGWPVYSTAAEPHDGATCKFACQGACPWHSDGVSTLGLPLLYQGSGFGVSCKTGSTCDNTATKSSTGCGCGPFYLAYYNEGPRWKSVQPASSTNAYQLDRSAAGYFKLTTIIPTGTNHPGVTRVWVPAGLIPATKTGTPPAPTLPTTPTGKPGIPNWKCFTGPAMDGHGPYHPQTCGQTDRCKQGQTGGSPSSVWVEVNETGWDTPNPVPVPGVAPIEVSIIVSSIIAMDGYGPVWNPNKDCGGRSLLGYLTLRVGPCPTNWGVMGVLPTAPSTDPGYDCHCETATGKPAPPVPHCDEYICEKHTGPGVGKFKTQLECGKGPCSNPVP